jgi:hypothetical protein
VRAFKLKAEYADLEAGGVAIPPNGEMLDVGARLREGIVVVENPQEGIALEGFHAMRELSGKEAADAQAIWDKNSPSKVEAAKKKGDA